MNNVCIVVQRYGIEVNGGAEYHAKILAEQLIKKNKVTILTTTAIDYHGWDNYYKPGSEIINGIEVLRFSTTKIKKRKLRKARRAILEKKKYYKLLKFFGIFEWFKRKFNFVYVTQQDVDIWISGQGPYCPDLIAYIKKNEAKYDAFIFFTYLYYPTYCGMPLVKDKSIFIPTAHDEPLLYTKPYENLFSIPKFIMFNTESEKDLIFNKFKNVVINFDISGVGVEPFKYIIEDLPINIEPKKYFIYVGRIDVAKGCNELLNFFENFIIENPQFSDIKLVLVGKNYMSKVFNNNNIIYTGFVSENEKYNLISNSIALIIPSLYESLSLVTLESMVSEIPVIANFNCEVLKNHIINSNSGGGYFNQKMFNSELIRFLKMSEEDLESEGLKAKKYVLNNYTWVDVMNKFDKAISFVSSKN